MPVSNVLLVLRAVSGITVNTRFFQSYVQQARCTALPRTMRAPPWKLSPVARAGHVIGEHDRGAVLALRTGDIPRSRDGRDACERDDDQEDPHGQNPNASSALHARLTGAWQHASREGPSDPGGRHAQFHQWHSG
jgi:hypothetical protein